MGGADEIRDSRDLRQESIGEGAVFRISSAKCVQFAVKNNVYVRFCLFPQRKCGIILAFQGEKRKNKWTLQMKCGVIPPHT